MDGILGDERAPLQNGQECDYGAYYRRSSSLQSFNAIPSPTLTSILIRKAGIFGVIGVFQFPDHFDANVWWAFCKLWGPLTNTLHHGAGKVDISLYDLERFGGLPILGAIYEEFLPPNKDLVGHNKYPVIVAKLLRIHAELCKLHKVKHIYYDL
ncbi:hypothetical protein Cgig2_009849 [Carnegiea gigantea]|uniref:Uncharacterized protein n=1 Tax=Carnegiea gigantea TaxID=171969 RepID=A0A9Q1QMV8_9CARY|nr:hypothetical protein Cgig2_009849 [Carnegiea gigantea]